MSRARRACLCASPCPGKNRRQLRNRIRPHRHLPHSGHGCANSVPLPRRHEKFLPNTFTHNGLCVFSPLGRRPRCDREARRDRKTVPETGEIFRTAGLSERRYMTCRLLATSGTHGPARESDDAPLKVRLRSDGMLQESGSRPDGPGTEIRPSDNSPKACISCLPRNR